jgi:hypothetical protein
MTLDEFRELYPDTEVGLNACIHHIDKELNK